MKKIMYFYENYKMPLRIVYFGFLLIAFGFLIQNENVNIFYTFTNSFLLMFSNGCLLLGKALVINFPLIFMLYAVCKKANSGIPIALAMMGYFTFLITTLIFAPQNLSSYAYATNSGINSVVNFSSLTKYPLETGLIGSFVVAYITRFSFIRSRHRTSHSLLGFLHKDLAAMIYNTVLCSLAGILASYLFPIAYNLLSSAITYISKDLNDPSRLFIYGLLDRVLSILGLGNFIRNPFWNTALGGSYQTLTGQAIVGDVNIWKYVKDSVTTYLGCGRFITPYYVINMFMAPCVYIGIYCSITDKKEKRTLIFPFIGVTILSIICGNPLPLELWMLFTCPVLLLAFILLEGSLFALLTKQGIYLGSSISASDTITGMPGSFPDFIINIRSVMHYDAIVQIAIIGLIFGLICLFITILYFRHLTFNIISQSKDKKFVEEIVEAIGGYSNIKEVGSGLYRVNFTLYDNESIDFEELSSLSLCKTSETRDGVSIQLGSSSYIIAKMINKSLDSEANITDIVDKEDDKK